MKGVIFHLTKTDNTMQASARIAKYLQSILGWPLIDDYSNNVPPEALDVVLYVNSPSAFTNPKFFYQIIDFIKLSKNQIYVNNDYILTPASQIIKYIKPKRLTIWSTCPYRKSKNFEKNIYVNWNMLTYAPVEPVEDKAGDLIYYGALRPNRKEYISKFLNHPNCVISTNKRSFKEVIEMCPEANIIDKFKNNLIGEIAKYKASIYLEDPYSHSHYCSPANRFYECLSAGICQFFEEGSIKTMEGYDIKNYIVKNKEDLFDKLKYWEWFAEEQKSWRKDYQGILLDQVNNAIQKLEA